MIALELFPERNCARCTVRLKAEWGCDAYPTLEIEDGEEVEVWENAAELPVEIDGEDWWQCPRRPVLDNPWLFQKVIDYRNIREAGFLPFPGSYMQQPNLMAGLLSVVDQALWEVDKRKADADKARRGDQGDQ